MTHFKGIYRHEFSVRGVKGTGKGQVTVLFLVETFGVEKLKNLTKPENVASPVRRKCYDVESTIQLEFCVLGSFTLEAIAPLK